MSPPSTGGVALRRPNKKENSTIAKKPAISTLASGFRSSNKLNENLQALKDAFDNTLSLDGSTPNSMLADLDLNSNRAINLADPVDESDAATKAYVDAATGDTSDLVRTVEYFGAVGDSTPTAAATDDTTAILEAVAWSNETGYPIHFGPKTYNVRDTLDLTGATLFGVGSTNSGNGSDASTVLLFSHLGTKPAIKVDLTTSKKQPTVSGMDIRAASWDPTTGCTGYGADISARVIFRDVVINSFGDANLFLHGGVSGGGPYFSLFENCRFVYSQKHGVIVGTGANDVTFLNCEAKWNGAPSYGVAPTAAGSYDGLYVDHEGVGNPGSAYQSYWPQSLNIIGGDFSYNSRYGYNFQSVRDTNALMPGYAEGNYSADGYEVKFGLNVQNVFSVLGTVQGGHTAVKTSDIYGPYTKTNSIYVGGKFIGGGGTGTGKLSYMFEDVGVVLASNAAGTVQVYTEPTSADDGFTDIRLNGTTARVRIGSNLAEYLEVNGTDGVKYPAKDRAVKVIDYIPIASRASAIAGTFTSNATAYIQAAIDTGKNVDLCGLTLYASGLTMANNQQELVSSSGTANLYKNANGAILTISGNDVIVHNVTFRGQSTTYTGDNLVITGERPSLLNCGSLDAAGRALKATKNLVRVHGSNPKWQTADATASGYDIEIGTSGTATLYHHLQDIYTGQSTGGLLLIDIGSHTVVGGQFGKYTIQAGTSPAGSNGGKCIGARILGAISLGLASAKMAACDISGVALTFAAGTSGCSVDESNTFSSGFTVTNSGNGNNYIARNVSAGSFPTIKYGAAADAIELSFVNGEAMRCNYGLTVPNATAFMARNQAGTGNVTVAYVSGAADNVFLGAGVGSSSTIVQAGSGGNRFDVSGTRYGTMTGTLFYPETDNAKALGNTTNRFSNIYAYNHYVGSANLSITSGSGTPEGAVTAPVGSIFMRSDTGQTYQKQSGTGNTGWAALSASTVSPDSITNVELANMAANTIKGRVTASTGDPEDLTPEQARTVLGITSTIAAPAAEYAIGSILKKCGYYAGGATNPTITFTNAFPTACINVQITPVQAANDTQTSSLSIRHVAIQSLTASNFKAFCSAEDEPSDVFAANASVPFYWEATGY